MAATSSRGLGDLLLADLEEHLGGRELVVGPGLLPDDDVAYAVAAGEVLGRLGVDERGEGDQLGVALGVDVGDRGRDVLALLLSGRPDPASSAASAGASSASAAASSACISASRSLGDLDLAARRGELGLGVGELGPGGLEARAGAAQLRARLVEVVAGRSRAAARPGSACP